MRTLIISIVLMFPLTLAHAQRMSSQPVVPVNPPLSYMESSTGLGQPYWEGGRTEYEFGDVNHDGFVDIVSIGDHGSPYVNTNQHGLMVWFGNGTGANWSVKMTGDFGYGGVALGDVNNDGLLDAGYGMHHAYSSNDLGDQLIEVALGDGSGRAWTPWDDGLDDASHGIGWGMFGTDFADVDHDNDLDLVSVSFGSGDGMHVYLNNMDGTWTRSFGFQGGNCGMIVRFGDVNGDGHPDIAADLQDGTVWLGDGAGGFVLADGNLPSPGTWGYHDGTDLGDVDNDGCQELSFTMAGGGVHVYKWKPGDRWTSLSQGLPTSSDYEYTQLCDMDCNGTLDLVTAGEGKIAVWCRENNAWIEAHSFVTVPQGNMQAFRTGFDVDFNGRPDMVLLSEEGSWPSYKNKMRFFKEGTKPSWRRLRITYPRGKESLIRGSVSFIHWLAAVPGSVGGTSTVALQLSTSGPAGPWTDLAAGLPNNGRFQWHISSSLPASQNCRLRLRLNTLSRTGIYTMTRSFTLH